MSVLVMAAAMSLRCKVRRLFSSEWFHERCVNSRMNISQACNSSLSRLPPGNRILHLEAASPELHDLNLLPNLDTASNMEPSQQAGLPDIVRLSLHF